ncbi:hypothetical protein SDC9_130728 [bioreactor metagenome]|uniref:Uncharacterized protein n=1 Tax=bioreactor metagenome TaxID=1076179 RepID=A0A645D380_9ZZZZ
MLWEREKEVGDVSFGVDGENWNVIHEGFFKKSHAQPRFAASRHTDDHSVGCEVFGIVEYKRVTLFPCRGIYLFTQVKLPHEFEVFHHHSSLLLAFSTVLLK